MRQQGIGLVPAPWALASVALVVMGAAVGRGAPPAPAPEPSDDPASVLILVNDETPPERGTGRKGASRFVAEHYAQVRGVPGDNIVRLSVPLACCENDPRAWDSWNITWETFEREIRAPIRRHLEKRRLAGKIRYIVSTYGIPVNVGGGPGWKADGVSIDSLLASLESGKDGLGLRNPYHGDRLSRPPRFREWTNPAGWRMYLVTRLDGPSAAIAAALVDKAVNAEQTLTRESGIGYFDYRNCCQGDPGYFAGDRSVLEAYRLSVAQGFRSVLNDQTQGEKSMIKKAPRALWAWGWYSGPQAWEGYEFVDGAVGAQLTSYSANSVRTRAPGAWVPLWLEAGITATWGATSEPTVQGYALGDALLYHFWTGYNFAESAYIAAPVLNHMMVFVGDPLYSPLIFRTRHALRSPGP